MFNVNITVRDPSGRVSRDFTIALDDVLRVDELAMLLVQKLVWPVLDIHGEAIGYGIRIERSKVVLTGSEQVGVAGILNGDIITLGPVFTHSAGGAPSRSQQQSAPGATPYVMTPLKS